jgi:hypothetical protein
MDWGSQFGSSGTYTSLLYMVPHYYIRKMYMFLFTWPILSSTIINEICNVCVDYLTSLWRQYREKCVPLHMTITQAGLC